MKNNIPIIGILVLMFSSCDYRQNSEGSTQQYCQNELFLLSADSIAPITNYNLIDIRDDVWVKFEAVLEKVYCQQVRLKVDFILESNDTVQLLLNSSNFIDCDFENEGPPPPFNPFVHWIHIYLDQNDTVYIRRKISRIDSAKEEVIKRYQELEVDEYPRVNIALLWDKETDRKKLTGLIEDCINGYLEVANNRCVDIFGRSICELNLLELELLSKKVPFKLRTDFWDNGVDDNEFVPSDIPPPPISY